MRIKRKPKRIEPIPQPFYKQIITENHTYIFFNPEIPIEIILLEKRILKIRYDKHDRKMKGKAYLNRVKNKEVTKIPLGRPGKYKHISWITKNRLKVIYKEKILK